MVENRAIKKSPSTTGVVVVTALLTLMISGGGAYYLGYLGTGDVQDTVRDSGHDGSKEQKIAYWRAPMNPTEIYDKPGKSAMGMDLVPVYEDTLSGSGAPGGDSQRKIAYWRAPMNPTEIYDKPGKSAMGMDLTPVYEDELVSGVDVKVDPVIQQNMGIRTAAVETGALVHTIRTYGHVTYDETRIGEVSSKISGWIEKIHVDFIGKYIKQGEPLFELYSPDLFAAQEEYMVAYRNLSRMSIQANKGLLKAARQRLTYFDVAESEIREMEDSGRIKKTVTIRSPFDGVVVLKNAVEGSFVKVGARVYRIADLSRVWVEVHIFEYELPWVKQGQMAKMTLPYMPGKTFSGRISFVYPYLERKTRDVVILLEFENPEGTLKPDMFADVEIQSRSGEGMIIPSEAVIRSGERNIVFVLRGENKFSPRDVTLGLNLDHGKVQVLGGLAPEEIVVTSGQFLLDSESKLKEAVQKMMEAKRAAVKEKRQIEEDAEDDFFKELEPEKDFFEDLKDDEEFFKDMEQDK